MAREIARVMATRAQQAQRLTLQQELEAKGQWDWTPDFHVTPHHFWRYQPNYARLRLFQRAGRSSVLVLEERGLTQAAAEALVNDYLGLTPPPTESRSTASQPPQPRPEEPAAPVVDDPLQLARWCQDLGLDAMPTSVQQVRDAYKRMAALHRDNAEMMVRLGEARAGLIEWVERNQPPPMRVRPLLPQG